MPLYHKDIAVPQDDLPVGFYRNASPYSNGVTTTAFPSVPDAGSEDTTGFTLLYIPTIGIYKIEYYISNYTSGTIQEAVFKYRSDLLGVGDIILNQNWASPTAGTLRSLSGLSLQRGYCWLCLRMSLGGSATIATNSSSTNGSGSTDLMFYVNSKSTNGGFFPVNTSGSVRVFQVYDNSVNPSVRLNYNGTLSDFSPYQNLVNKYLICNITQTSLISPYQIFPPRVRITRTG
jgi:hypothetical protein